MSLDHLRDLKAWIDALIEGSDINLELARRQGRDALLTNQRWGVRDRAANWSTFAHPALEAFRESTIRLLGWSASDQYCGTGAEQFAGLLGEFSF